MIGYILLLLPILFAFTLISILIEYAFKNRRNLYFMGIVLAFALVSAVFVNMNFGHTNFIKLYPLLVHIPSFIAFHFVSKYKGIKLVFVLLTVFVLCTIPTAIGLLVASLFHGKLIILYGIKFLMYPPTGFFVYRYLRPSLLYMLRYTDKGWLAFSTIPILYYAIIYFVYGYNEITSANIVIMVLCLVLTLTSYGVILKFFRQTREQLLMQNERSILLTQMDAAQVHLETLKESQEKTTIYRHDMRHHLRLINEYLSDNNNKGAGEYIRSLEKDIENSSVEEYCDNYAINLILRSYITKAKLDGIQVNVKINLPEKAHISDMDLCVIFANAIENATIACKEVQDQDKRFIDISCKLKNDKFFIKITNSYEGDIGFKDGLPISTRENHGIGTKSIVAIAGKYIGVCSFRALDGTFTLNLIL